MVYNDIKRNSHKQQLTTKKCVATHTNYLLNFKTALYSNALVMKPFNNSRKLFQTKITITKPKASLLLNALLCIRPLTFITEVFCLVTTVRCSL